MPRFEGKKLDLTGLENTSDDADPNLEELFKNTCLSELGLANGFIQELQNASLDGRHSGLDTEALDQLKNPPTALFTLKNQLDL